MGNQICRSREKKTNEVPEHSFDELLKNKKEIKGMKLSREKNKHNIYMKPEIINDLDSIFMIP